MPHPEMFQTRVVDLNTLYVLVDFFVRRVVFEKTDKVIFEHQSSSTDDTLKQIIFGQHLELFHSNSLCAVVYF
jgi:hypothetical protein